MESLHLVASGRVQGVLYRASALELANRLGIDAVVRNRPDGSVEMFVKGDDPASVAAFAGWAKVGPRGSQVMSLETRISDSLASWREFDLFTNVSKWTGSAGERTRRISYESSADFEKYNGYMTLPGTAGDPRSVTAYFSEPVTLPLGFVKSLPDRYTSSTYKNWDKYETPEQVAAVGTFADILSKKRGADVITLQVTPHGRITVDEGHALIRAAGDAGQSHVQAAIQYFGGGEHNYNLYADLVAYERVHGRRKLADLIDKPPAPNEVLKAAFKQHQAQVKSAA